MIGLRRLLFFGLLVGAGVFAWLLTYGDGLLRQDVRAPSFDAATEPAPRAAGEPSPAEPGEAGLEPPTPAFDIVRVEDSGNVLIAGLAPPGWTVWVEIENRTIGKVEAGFDGAWVLTPESPLPPGDHSLSLKATAPDGSRAVRAKGRVAVSVSRDSAPAVVALSEENEPTRILQSGGLAKAEPRADDTSRPVTFSAVDYEDKELAARLYLGGEAPPGARIALYIDNRFIGSVKADASGAWQFTLTDILEGDAHALRADHVDDARGTVLSRAEVTFNPRAVAVASTEGGETRSALAGRRDTPDVVAERRPVKADAGDAGLRDPAAAISAAPAAGAGATGGKKAIVVRRGDTLWHIAEKHYGSGVRFTKIFRNNRGQIRNPHRIYPGQQFELPR